MPKSRISAKEKSRKNQPKRGMVVTWTMDPTRAKELIEHAKNMNRARRYLNGPVHPKER